ncbi:LysE family transporter [Amycolatopsis sp. NPDC003865]
MNAAATLGTVLLAYLPAAVSPGPNFVLIAHTAAAGTRRSAAAVALGVVAAGGALAAVAVFGLGGVLARTPWLATALRVVCGGYLTWLGVRLWLRARAPDAGPGRRADPSGSASPSGPADPGGSASPSGSADPGGSASPSGSADPGGSASPSGPPDPSEPANPSRPPNPNEPANPSRPPNPSEPANPSEPPATGSRRVEADPAARPSGREDRPGEPETPAPLTGTPPDHPGAREVRPGARRPAAHFRRGVLSNLTNPKAAAFFGSVLTAALPPTEPTAVKAAAIGLVVVASAAWHLSVALLFSSPATQRWYAHAEPALNRVVGTILVVLGVTLAATP